MYNIDLDHSQYQTLVQQALESGVLTNSGPLAGELEVRLKEHLGCPNLVLTSSGTAALQVAIRTLGLAGKIITTPFTYVATANAIAWLGLEPVFVDIREDDLGLDVVEVEKAICPEVTGILPVHVFGNPCQIDELGAVAAATGLTIVYDAAACFGVRFKQQPIVNYGSASVLSFHASKVFSTVEGGAVVFRDDNLYERARAIVHHGCARDRTPVCLGFNAKLSELHAAFGLCVLERINERIAIRRRFFDGLRSRLCADHRLRFPTCDPRAIGNGAYCAILFENEDATLRTLNALQRRGIEARRYFYPSLNTLPHFGCTRRLPVAEDITRRVLCVGFANVSEEGVDRIAETIECRR